MTLDTLHRTFIQAVTATAILTAVYALTTRQLPTWWLAAGAAQCAALAVTSTLRLRRARTRS